MFKLILCVALIGAICPLGTALKKLPDMQIQPVVDVDDAAPVAEPEAPVDAANPIRVKDPIRLIRKPIRGPRKPIDRFVKPIRGPVLTIDESVDPNKDNVEPEQSDNELVDPIEGYVKNATLVAAPKLAILPIPPRNCANRCTFRARCNPYAQAYVYAIVNGKCRIFQNGCLFSLENCSRANRCLRPLKQIRQNVCRVACKRLCLAVRSPVCASFPVTNEDGTSDFDMLTFANRCELDRYACLANRAYVSEPTPGACA